MSFKCSAKKIEPQLSLKFAQQKDAQTEYRIPERILNKKFGKASKTRFTEFVLEGGAGGEWVRGYPPFRYFVRLK